MQEILAPGESATVEGLMAALDQAEAERRRASRADSELVAAFDQLGFALRKLGLLHKSEFWQEFGPIDPGTVITKA